MKRLLNGESLDNSSSSALESAPTFVNTAELVKNAKINTLKEQEKFQKAVPIGGAERSEVELIGAG